MSTRYFTPNERDWAEKVASEHPLITDKNNIRGCVCKNDGYPAPNRTVHIVLAALASIKDGDTKP